MQIETCVHIFSKQKIFVIKFLETNHVNILIISFIRAKCPWIAFVSIGESEELITHDNDF